MNRLRTSSKPQCDLREQVVLSEFTLEELNAIWVSLSARVMHLTDNGDDYGRLPRYEATLAKVKGFMDEVVQRG